MEPAKKQTALIHELEGSHFDLLTGRDRFSCRGPGTGTNYEKRVNGTRNSVRKFQPGKRAHLFRFSTFSGNFPVGRTDETCSIYRQPEIPEILTKWKRPISQLLRTQTPLCAQRKTGFALRFLLPKVPCASASVAFRARLCAQNGKTKRIRRRQICNSKFHMSEL